ncbi:MAG: DUF2752 domain-containing protein [Planctomycetaceae bacterium]|jgi:hypothetical protein|nr:DUF2752 domain-containing protein [Planctomycetaceae bacterium]
MTSQSEDQSKKPKNSFDRNEVWFFVVMSFFCFVGLVVLYFVHPSEYSFMPRCPFNLLTGMYCPGCGSMRAAHYLLHQNFSASFRHHPFFVPFIITVLFFYVKRAYELCRNKTVSFKYELLFCKIILCFVVIFFIVRNIPVSSLDWMRPPKTIVQAEQ